MPGDLNERLGREDIFRPTIGNECLQQDSDDNGVRNVNFTTSKNVVVKITTFLLPNIIKYTLTSLEGNTYNQIDHVLNRRWHSSRVMFFFFQGTWLWCWSLSGDWKIREILAVSKKATQNFKVDRFKAPPDRREIFAAVATATISPKFRVDFGKEIRVVIHTKATVSW